MRLSFKNLSETPSSSSKEKYLIYKNIICSNIFCNGDVENVTGRQDDTKVFQCQVQIQSAVTQDIKLLILRYYININICLWIFLHIRLLFSHKKLELYVTKSETLVNYFHQLAYNEMIVIFSLRNDQITSSHKALHVWDSHDPILRGHFCLSIGKSSRFMMQVAMIVSLWE